MSAAKRGSRFSYLTSAAKDTQTKPQHGEESSGQEHDEDSSSVGGANARIKTNRSGGGREERGLTKQSRNVSHESTAQELASVPKGQGRMKQERSQLNVRIPTILKRQATAKAVLEGRDIGEVVEELLREYLER
jgi:cytidylate kinase